MRVPSLGPSPFVLFLAALLPTCQACSSTEQAVHTSDAAPDQVGGSSGSGGTPWTGGTGGSGGAVHDASTEDGALDGPDASPELVWEELGEVAGIYFDRLVNTSAFQLFHWKPCMEGAEAVAGCESAEFLVPEFYGDELKLSPGSVVHDNGSDVLIGIMLIRQADCLVVFTDENGFVQEAFRARTSSGPIATWHPAIWGSRYAVLGARDEELLNKDGKHPAVFGTFGSGDYQVVALDTWGVMPFGTGVVRSPMGEDRWFWVWSPQAAFVSFSSHDGSDARVVYQQYEHPEVWAIGLPVTTCPCGKSA